MKPSEAIQAGKCPSCLGTGVVDRLVPVEGLGPCSSCHGWGRWPPPIDYCPMCMHEVEYNPMTAQNTCPACGWEET